MTLLLYFYITVAIVSAFYCYRLYKSSKRLDRLTVIGLFCIPALWFVALIALIILLTKARKNDY